jgi:hypothetical protein
MDLGGPTDAIRGTRAVEPAQDGVCGGAGYGGRSAHRDEYGIMDARLRHQRHGSRNAFREVHDAL